MCLSLLISQRFRDVFRAKTWLEKEGEKKEEDEMKTRLRV